MHRLLLYLSIFVLISFNTLLFTSYQVKQTSFIYCHCSTLTVRDKHVARYYIPVQSQDTQNLSALHNKNYNTKNNIWNMNWVICCDTNDYQHLNECLCSKSISNRPHNMNKNSPQEHEKHYVEAHWLNNLFIQGSSLT